MRLFCALLFLFILPLQAIAATPPTTTNAPSGALRPPLRPLQLQPSNYRPDLNPARYAHRVDRRATFSVRPVLDSRVATKDQASPDAVAMRHTQAVRYLSGIETRTRSAGPAGVGPSVPRPYVLAAASASPSPTPAPALSTTGIKRWWSFVRKALPGIGETLVNEGTANLVLQATDFHESDRGLDFDFTRTYNSQSSHDATGSDGSPSVYGNGWTNTLDAHLTYDAAANVISVFDGTGARYDYQADGNGAWTPPPGMNGVWLYPDGKCGYYWDQKNGIRLHFKSPISSTGCVEGALAGRLDAIYGRNHNNLIALTYNFSSPNIATIQNLGSITVAHSDTRSMTLNFAAFGSFTELASITLPDMSTPISYNYDGNGNLLSVTRQGNATDEFGRGAQITSLTAGYTYWAGTHQLQSASDPRYVWSSANAPAANAEGGYFEFTYGSTNSIPHIYIDDYEVVNFVPNDNTGVAIAGSTPAGATHWRQTSFSFPFASVGNVEDTQGHAATWASNPTTGAVTVFSKTWYSSALSTFMTWDTNNNVLSVKTSLGQITNYTYDSHGNVTEIQQPSVTTNVGTGRPTTLISYDKYNNVLAVCDPQYDWSGVTTCTAAAGVASYSYDTTDAQEPYGKLVQTTSALGYRTTISYNTSTGGGNDYGLPTDYVGDSIAQLTVAGVPAKTALPQLHLTYTNPSGQLVAINNGNNTNQSAAYDTLNRLVSTTDQDGVTTRICYNVDGTVSAIESAQQAAFDKGIACGPYSDGYAYDADGNVINAVTHYGETSTSPASQNGITHYWYDGDGRMVEVSEPYDGTIATNAPALTRYMYDLTANSYQLHVGNSSNFAAFGNLYKTQECVWKSGVCTWTDISGTAYDAFDRVVNTFAYQPFGSIEQWTYRWDENGYAGLPTSSVDPLGVTTVATYTAASQVASLSYSDGITPSRNFTYDPDGRTASVTSSKYGTDQYTYDAAGDVLTYQEGSSSGFTSAENLTYTYYPNGQRKTMSVNASVFPSAVLFQYAYRSDGLRTMLAPSGYAKPFLWSYTNAGRASSQSDPYTGHSLAANGHIAAQTLNPRTESFDQYGQLLTLTLPGGASYGTTSPMTYDAEGDLQSFSVAQNGLLTGKDSYGIGYVSSSTFAYNILGEYSGQYIASSTGSVHVGTRSYDYGNGSGLQPIDPITGASTASIPSLAAGCKGAPYARTWDTAARFIGVTWTDSGCAATGGNDTFGFDAQNHTTSEKTVGVSSPTDVLTNSYAWGPGGQMRQYTSQDCPDNDPANPGPCTYGQYSLHWDGSQLLFVTNSSGGLSQFNIESLAAAQCPSGSSPTTCEANALVADRDVSGTLVDWHNATGTAGTFATPDLFNVISVRNSYQLVGVDGVFPAAGTAVTAPAGDFIGMARVDGYQIGNLTFQGVRAYSSLLQQFTTPDAYAGSLDTPVSQRPYTWVGNDPVSNIDSSGFETVACQPNATTPCKSPNQGGGAAPAPDLPTIITISTTNPGALGCPMCWLAAQLTGTSSAPPTLKTIAWITVHPRTPDIRKILDQPTMKFSNKAPSPECVTFRSFQRAESGPGWTFLQFLVGWNKVGENMQSPSSTNMGSTSESLLQGAEGARNSIVLDYAANAACAGTISVGP